MAMLSTAIHYCRADTSRGSASTIWLFEATGHRAVRSMREGDSRDP